MAAVCWRPCRPDYWQAGTPGPEKEGRVSSRLASPDSGRGRLQRAGLRRSACRLAAFEPPALAQPRATPQPVCQPACCADMHKDWRWIFGRPGILIEETGCQPPLWLQWHHTRGMSSQINGNSTVCSTIVQVKNKENIKVPHYWPSWGDFHRLVLERASNAESVSMSWRRGGIDRDYYPGTLSCGLSHCNLPYVRGPAHWTLKRNLMAPNYMYIRDSPVDWVS